MAAGAAGDQIFEPPHRNGKRQKAYPRLFSPLTKASRWARGVLETLVQKGPGTNTTDRANNVALLADDKASGNAVGETVIPANIAPLSEKVARGFATMLPVNCFGSQ
jgi:hypothetical protein